MLLMTSVFVGNAEVVQLLLGKANMKAANRDVSTPLFLAAKKTIC